MKRYGNLWERLICWENLVEAAHRSRRGKRSKGCVQRFEFNLEKELLRLQAELESGEYAPGEFKTHWISRPKPRMISAAPYRDRVVHHALMNVLEPILERHFHPHSFACRRGKGTHAAADRLQVLMHRNRYVLQCDIRRFFPSIDHEILKACFRRLIKDRRVLRLMDTIVDSSNPQEPAHSWLDGDDLFTPVERRRGLPIGNLTSQWFANWYLNSLDHYLSSRFRVGGYVRYCDDFLVLEQDRTLMLEVREAIKEHLAGLRLKLHTSKSFIRPVKTGVTFVGMRIWCDHRLLRKDNIRSFKRRICWMQKAYATRRIDWDYIKPRLASWIGHSCQTDSRQLLRRLSKDWRFRRATPDELSCSSRRQLEQQRQQLPGGQPQQQHSRQPQQQQRVSGMSLSGFSPALSLISRNGNVHGYCQRGGENPRHRPELTGQGPVAEYAQQGRAGLVGKTPNALSGRIANAAPGSIQIKASPFTDEETSS